MSPRSQGQCLAIWNMTLELLGKLDSAHGVRVLKTTVYTLWVIDWYLKRGGVGEMANEKRPK